jgi:DNA segregation ATPase FtsK/SpoIIIE-like protein
MHPLNPDFVLPELRRQLEEILVMVKSDHNGSALPAGENSGGIAGPHVECSESESPCESFLVENDQPPDCDDIYDDALVVVTEFGQASPAILQMWLSIDYGRAIRILNRFQADGLVSPKGRIRHKAYSLRRSERQVTNATT